MYKLKTLFIAIALLISTVSHAQTIRSITTDIFTVTYSEVYQQPLEVSYKVLCPTGDASRKGMTFKGVDDILTSDNADYSDNPYDKGHMAPAASFNCDKETLKKTFSYLNCALQHQGLNRGPWKELERFERNLAKVFTDVSVVIVIHFDNENSWLDTGAMVPSGFTKVINIKDNNKIIDTFTFVFPNKNVAGRDWNEFRIYN